MRQRIATLGGSPSGTPGAIVGQRDWDAYSLGRADTAEHPAAPNVAYNGIVESHRAAIETTVKPDPVS